jgi:hypothetical protein
MIRLKHLITETKNIKPFSTSKDDEYEYKKENNTWYTKLKTSDKWIDMKQKLSSVNYQSAIKILSKYDTETPVKKDVNKPKEKPDMSDLPKPDNAKSEVPKSDIEKSKLDGTKSDSVILMGGLDYRPGDYKIEQQKSILQSSLNGRTVIAHRYTDLSGVLQSIKANPGASVVLFSAGCSYASKIANAIQDKTKLYIVEPYAKSSNTVKSVRSAVNNGVPTSNVLTGSTTARGNGIVSGATNTPDVKGGGMSSHWNALKVVGKQI